MKANISHETKVHPSVFFIAFGTGGLLSLMIHFNGELARSGNALFSSWVAHGTGTIAAVVFLVLLSGRGKPAIRKPLRTPLWAYLGGVSGAATVMLTSTTVNSPVGLTGTLALGLAGQIIFSLVADKLGLFGLPKRSLDRRDMATLGFIFAGSALIILASGVLK